VLAAAQLPVLVCSQRRRFRVSIVSIIAVFLGRLCFSAIESASGLLQSHRSHVQNVAADDKVIHFLCIYLDELGLKPYIACAPFLLLRNESVSHSFAMGRGRRSGSPASALRRLILLVFAVFDSATSLTYR